MATRIYDRQSDPDLKSPGGTGGELFVLCLGVVLLVWFFREIGGAVAADIRYFPAAFRESPVLTLIFALLKLFGYPAMGCFFGLLVYAPIRNTFLKRIVSGQIMSFSPNMDKRGVSYLSIQLGQHELRVRGSSSLEKVVAEGARHGQLLQFSLGVLGFVLAIDKLDAPLEQRPG